MGASPSPHPHGGRGLGGGKGSAAVNRAHRFTSQVVVISPVAGSFESFNWMPMAANSSRMRSAAAKFLALRAAVRQDGVGNLLACDIEFEDEVFVGNRRLVYQSHDGGVIVRSFDLSFVKS